MTNKGQRQVHPAASALFILLVLAAVQWIWWRFLVYQEHGKPSGPPAGGSGSIQPPLVLIGRPDVAVIMFAGDQEPGDTDGPGYFARFDRPTGLALDAHGNLYVADTGNHRIRRVAPSGETATIAGSEAGYVDGPTLQARFNAPCGVCVGPDDAIYVADTGNHCLRRILNGVVTTVRIGSSQPGPSTPAPGARASWPAGLAYAAGAKPGLLVADAGGRKIQQVSIDGAPQNERQMPGGPLSVVGDPLSVALPDTGTLLLGAQTLHNVPIESENAMTAEQARSLCLRHPAGLCRLGSGWLATDTGFGAVFLLGNGKAQVVAGFCSSAGPLRGNRDGDGSVAMFGTLDGVATDGKRYAYVADTANNTIRRLDIAGVIGH